MSTRDVFTDRILAVARRLFKDEPERLKKVVDALTDSEADLRSEFGKVVRSVNQRTKKIEINKQGFHSDLTEAARMMHSGLVRAPALPEAKPTVLTVDDSLNAELARERREGAKRASRTMGMDLMRGRIDAFKR
jgi:hypothetical protein